MVKVWSLFVRVSHWVLVAAFFTAFFTRDSEWTLLIHANAGYIAGWMILARICWGLIAKGYENFRAFPPDVKEAVRYALSFFSGHAKRYIGHNPAGSIVIYGMLTFGLLTVISGIVVYNDGYLPFKSAPLQYFHEYMSWTWVGLVAAHITGVIAESLLHRDNLIAAMITGNKKADL
jgi:cytochrome b